MTARALESFKVRRGAEPVDRGSTPPGSVPPDPRSSSPDSASFDQPLKLGADPGATVSFDDVGSPWYTLCEVRSPDRRGLLHTITVGIAAAGASVHSARLETVDGLAVDRFELTDSTRRKLDAENEGAVRVSSTAWSLRRRFGSW